MPIQCIWFFFIIEDLFSLSTMYSLYQFLSLVPWLPDPSGGVLRLGWHLHTHGCRAGQDQGGLANETRSKEIAWEATVCLSLLWHNTSMWVTQWYNDTVTQWHTYSQYYNHILTILQALEGFRGKCQPVWIFVASGMELCVIQLRDLFISQLDFERS